MELPRQVSDAFVLRRVATRRFAHIGGAGRGVGWAGIVELDADEAGRIRPLPGPGEVVRHHHEAPQQLFGPYWATDLAVVRTHHDELIAFGGSVPTPADDAELLHAASVISAEVTDVTPAKRLADELELLHAVRDVALLPLQTVADAAEQILRLATAALSCEVGVLQVGDASGRLHAWAADDTAGTLVPVLADLAATGGSRCVQDARAEGLPPRLCSYLAADLEVGTLVVGHTDAGPRGFTQLCQSLAESMTQAATTVLLAAAQHEEVLARADEASAEARRDPLTGLANRRAWDEALARTRSTAHAGRYVVICCDVDGLKQINDSMGHRVGDRLLLAAADALRGAVREGDLVARMSGDEFAVLLRDADDAVARTVTLRIAEQCQRIGAALALPLSLSIGTAGCSDPDELDQAVATADDRMYEGKRSRRRPATDPDATPGRE